MFTEEVMFSEGLVIWWAGCVRPGFPRDWKPPGLGFTCDTRLASQPLNRGRVRTQREQRDGWRGGLEFSTSGEKKTELGLNMGDCSSEFMYSHNHTQTTDPCTRSSTHQTLTDWSETYRHLHTEAPLFCSPPFSLHLPDACGGNSHITTISRS